MFYYDNRVQLLGAVTGLTDPILEPNVNRL